MQQFEDKYINIPYYNGEPTDYTAPLGLFDDDTKLKEEAPKIVNHIAQKLGYPVHDLEITDSNVYANIEDSLMKLSYLLNEYNVEEDYIDMYGREIEEEVSERVRYDNLNKIIRMSDAYATEAGTGGSVTKRKGHITTVAGQQEYNLKELFFDVEHPEEKGFTIRKIYHGRIPAMKRSGYLSTSPTTHENYNQVVGNVGIPSEFVMMPLSWTIAQTQNVQIRRKLFGSIFSFDLTGNNLIITPIPKQSFKLFFDYTLYSEESGENLDGIYEEDNKITSPTHLNFKMQSWSDLSQHYRSWVINYALAQTKITLGRNRSKFQSIPYLQGQISLDGSDLISSGESDSQILIEQLREHLDKLSIESEMEAKRNKAEYQTDILNKIPLGIYRF